MRDEEVAVVFLVTGVGAVVAMWSVYQHKRHAARMARLDVMKKALEHPGVDGQTKSTLVQLLAEQQRHDQLPFLHRFGGVVNVARVLVMSLGWIAFLFGGVVLLLHWAGIWPRYYQAEVEFAVLATLGFVALTLPSAVGELMRRSQGTATGQ